MGISELYGENKKKARRRARDIQHFTNRGSYIKIFCSLLHDNKKKHGSILMFYGDGGHGKSRLLHELKSEYAYILPQGSYDNLLSRQLDDEAFKGLLFIH